MANIPTLSNGWELVEAKNDRVPEPGDPTGNPNPWWIITYDKGQTQITFRSREENVEDDIAEKTGAL